MKEKFSNELVSFLMSVMTLDDLSLMSHLISEERFEENQREDSYDQMLEFMDFIDDILNDCSLWDMYTNLNRKILRFCVENLDKLHAYHVYRFCCGITHQREINTGFKVWKCL